MYVQGKIYVCVYMCAYMYMCLRGRVCVHVRKGACLHQHPHPRDCPVFALPTMFLLEEHRVDER